jgi:curved DNA-binding protein CbpA
MAASAGAPPLEDFYALLGCVPESTAGQITAEYRERARSLHPDKKKAEKEGGNEGKQGGKDMVELNDAYFWLSDPDRRKTYDKWRNSGLLISFKDWRELSKGGAAATYHWSNPAENTPQLTPHPHRPQGEEEKGQKEDQKDQQTGFFSNAVRPGSLIDDFRNYRV